MELHTAYLKWLPQPDITELEQKLAEPILAQIPHRKFVSIPPVLKRHFRYGPLVGWKDSMDPDRQLARWKE